jgi:hypothetical protein
MTSFADIQASCSDGADRISKRSPDGAERNPGRIRRLTAIPDFAPLHPGYGASLSAPAKRGRGTTGAREASEPWWRGRRTRSFVVVAEGLQRRRGFPNSSNVTSMLNVNARRQRLCSVEARAPSTTPSGWSPSPAIAVADEARGLSAARSPRLARQSAGTRGGSRDHRCGHRLRAVALRPGCAALRMGRRLSCPRAGLPRTAPRPAPRKSRRCVAAARRRCGWRRSRISGSARK